MDEDGIKCQSSSVDQIEAAVAPSNLKAETVETQITEQLSGEEG